MLIFVDPLASQLFRKILIFTTDGKVQIAIHNSVCMAIMCGVQLYFVSNVVCYTEAGRGDQNITIRRTERSRCSAVSGAGDSPAYT